MKDAWIRKSSNLYNFFEQKNKEGDLWGSGWVSSTSKTILSRRKRTEGKKKAKKGTAAKSP